MTKQNENMLGHDEPSERMTTLPLKSWEDFETAVSKFEAPDRRLWDEVWFRGQADAQWPLHTTLERRTTQVRTVSNYLNLIAEIKPAIETFTSATFSMPNGQDIEKMCREYDRFDWWLRDSGTYMAGFHHPF